MSHEDAHKPILDDNVGNSANHHMQMGEPVHQRSAEMPTYDRHCKCCIQRCEDDHNSCLAHCDLNEGYAFCLFLLSIIFFGPLCRYCYMCCSKTKNSPRWIWKNFFWLNIWIGFTYCILVGWIWDICFCYQAWQLCKGKDTPTCENCC